MIQVIVCFLLTCFLSVLHSENLSLENTLKLIPEEDRIALEHFYKALLCNSACGYTLFGSKPITVVDVLDDFFFEPSSYRIFLEKGWTTWVKWQHLFPSSRFLIRRESHKTPYGHHLGFYMIHKSRVLEVIQESLPLFQTKLHNMSAQQILEKICSPTGLVDEVLTSQALIGILFGYGQENSLLFEKEQHLCQSISKQMMPPFAVHPLFFSLPAIGQFFIKHHLEYNQDLPAKITDSLSLTREMEEFRVITSLRSTFDLSGSHYFLEQFGSPCFVCFANGKETKQLQESYSQTRSVLQKAYQQGSFLEVTLKQWTAP